MGAVQSKTIIHRLPLELREVIYLEAMQECINCPIFWRDSYPFTYANSSELEKAFVGDFRLYREIFAFRLRHSTLVIAQPDAEKMTMEEPLKRHPIEDLSKLVRRSIQKVVVQIPGEPEFIPDVRLPLSLWKLRCGSSMWIFPSQLLPSTLLGGLIMFPNLRDVVMEFLKTINFDGGDLMLQCHFKVTASWLGRRSSLIGRLDSLPSLTSFELNAPAFYHTGNDWKLRCDCPGCFGKEVNCATRGPSWIWSRIDERFAVRPVTWERELPAGLLHPRGECRARRTWTCAKGEKLMNFTSYVVENLYDYELEQRRKAVRAMNAPSVHISTPQLLLDNKPFSWS